MNTKPTPEQIKKITTSVSKDWVSTIDSITDDEMEYYRLQMMTNSEAILETQKRLIACGLACFSRKDFDSSTKFKEAAWLLSVFKAIADKKAAEGDVS